MTTESRTINVLGMTCGGCVKSVDNAVSQINGVKSISVDLNGSKAAVTYNTEATSIESIMEAIEDAGFDASVD